MSCRHWPTRCRRCRGASTPTRRCSSAGGRSWSRRSSTSCANGTGRWRRFSRRTAPCGIWSAGSASISPRTSATRSGRSRFSPPTRRGCRRRPRCNTRRSGRRCANQARPRTSARSWRCSFPSSAQRARARSSASCTNRASCGSRSPGRRARRIVFSRRCRGWKRRASSCVSPTGGRSAHVRKSPSASVRSRRRSWDSMRSSTSPSVSRSTAKS